MRLAFQLFRVRAWLRGWLPCWPCDGSGAFEDGRVSTIAGLIDDPAGQAAFMLPRLDEAQREMIVRLKPKRAWQRVSERDFDRVWPGIRTGAEWPDQFWFAGGHAHYPAGRKPLGKKRCSYGFSLNEAGLILRSLLLASVDRSPQGGDRETGRASPDADTSGESRRG